jgi:anti-anti-sigma factor
MTPEEYEKTVLEVLRRRLAEDCPNVVPRVFHRKKHQGKSGQVHEIDISAELDLLDVRLLFLVECKEYATRSVDNQDVVTFAYRINDVGAHKGIIATTVGFQEGAKKTAASEGIALVLVSDDTTGHPLQWTIALPCIAALALGVVIPRPRRLAISQAILSCGEPLIVEFIDKELWDSETVDEVKAELLGAADVSGTRDLLLNLKGVRRVSARMLAALLALHKNMRERGRTVRMFNLEPILAEVFELTKLDRLFQID